MQDTTTPPASAENTPPASPGAPAPPAGASARHAAPPPLPVRRVATPWTPAGAAPQRVARPAARPARRAWAARGLWLGLLAWGIAFAGLLLLGDETTRPAGEGLVVLAMILAVIAWGGARPRAAFALAPPAGPLLRLDLERAFRLALIGLAVVFIWRADTAFLAAPGDAMPVWLWLLGIVLLLCATVAWPGRLKDRPNPPAPFPRREGGETRPSLREGEESLPSPRRGGIRGGITRARLIEAACIAALLALAVVLRVWDLQNIPFAIHGDEILTGRTAYDSYLSGQASPIFVTLWTGIDLPALWFALIALALKIGGGTLAALRLPAALFGAATVLPFYGLVRAAWGRWAALAGTFILAVSASNVNFSRVTLNNIVTPFFWTLCFFFLLRGLRGKRPVDWVLAGLAAGLSEYGYYGTHLLPFILAAFAAYLLVIHWRQGRQVLGHLGLLALGYLAGFGPLLAYYTGHPQLYFGRGQGVLTWDHIPRDWADLQLMWNTLAPLMAENLLGISTHGDQSTVYWAPLLFPAEAALLALGVALLVWRWRHPPAFLMLMSGIGVLFVGGTLVHGVPFLAHWTPAFPAFYAAVAVPFGALETWNAARNPRHPQPDNLRSHSAFRIPHSAFRLLPAALVLGVLVLGWVNIDFYFNRYIVPRPEFEIRAAQDRWEAALGAGYQVRMVGRTWQPYDPEGMRYLVAGQDGATLYNPSAELPVPLAAGKGLAFIFAKDNAQYESAVAALYPGGTSGELKSHSGEHLFDTYVLTPAQAPAFYGVQLDLVGMTGHAYQWGGKVDHVGAFPPGAAGPLHARWSGALYIPAPASYRISLTGGPAGLVLDGQPAALPLTQTLLPGWHRLVVTADVAGPVPLQLRLGVAGGAASDPEVPTTALWPTPPTAGLLGAVGTPGTAAPARIDPFLGFTAVSEPIVIGPGQQAAAPLQARWVGGLQVPTGGSYTLEINTDGSAVLVVDGKPALAACSTGAAVAAPAQLTLTAGWHPLQLDYAAQPGRLILEFYWTPPGGTRSLVPPTALSYAPDPAAFQMAAPALPLLPASCGLPPAAAP
jgi:hypothetical protein